MKADLTSQLNINGSPVISKTSTLPYWKTFNKMKDRVCLIANKFCGNLQIWLGKTQTYVEVANDRRGSVPDVNPGVIEIYDIAASPSAADYRSIKNGCFAIFREQLVNNLYMLDSMVNHLGKEGLITAEESDDRVDQFYQEFIKFLQGEKDESKT